MISKARLAELPESPAVYLMKDRKGKIIYVGKAANAKSRVKSYFQSQHKDSSKTRALVRSIDDFEIIMVNTDLEALLLERTLIKHHKPKFNILLRDDKEYPLVRINMKAPWPRVQKVRRRKDDGALYFGPFGGGSKLGTLLGLIRKRFPHVRCSQREFETAKRPCNYYHMQRCQAPCTLPVDRDDYLRTMYDIANLLRGHSSELLSNLKTRMLEYSQEQKFEQAALIRDQIQAIQNLKKSQVVVRDNLPDSDYFGLETGDSQWAMQVLSLRDGFLIGGESFLMSAPLQEPDRALGDLLLQYYENRYVPKEISVPLLPESADTLALALVDRQEGQTPPLLKLPQRGDRKELVKLASRNAAQNLKDALLAGRAQNVEMEMIQETLDLNKLPRRMECIDISNIGGQHMVASCVCFINGRPAPELYRIYHLDERPEGPDDFGSITQIVKRRMTRAERDGDEPDLLVIDGGKGQLQAALNGMPTADPALQVCSLAKARAKKNTYSYIDTEVEHSQERVYLPNKEEPIPLETGSPAYRLLTQIRDEAHRFAIGHHRKRRDKSLRTSILEEVQGIGPVMRKKLFDQFGDLRGLRQASLEELKAIKGMSPHVAVNLHALLQEDHDSEQ